MGDRMNPVETSIPRININRCKRFSQNAWKKDLCSNCFKSKDEHKKPENIVKPANLANTPGSNLKPKQSILKNSSNLNSKNYSSNLKDLNGTTLSDNEINSSGNNCNVKTNGGTSLKVKFPSEESEVIGYGGGDNEFDSSDESCVEDDDDNNSGDVNECDEGRVDDDDDPDLQRLTKLNTDFNSITANLVDNLNNKNDADNSNNSDAKRLHIPLMLGHRTNNGSDGQKPTLLVSVKPFGSDTEINTIASNAKKNVSESKNINNLSESQKPIENKVTSTNISDSKQTRIDDNVSYQNSGSKDVESKVQVENSKAKENGHETLNGNDEDKVILRLDELQKSVNNKRINLLNNADFGKNNVASKDLDLPVTAVPAAVISTDTEVLNTHRPNDSGLIENRKTLITRGNVITKNHEQVKTKRFQSSTTNLVEESEKETSIALDKNSENYKNTNQNNSEDIKLVYLIVDQEEGSDTNKIINDELKNKENLLSKNNYNINNSDTEKKKFGVNKIGLESSNKLSTSLEVVDIKTLQHKNYKNVIGSDSKIKCISFKENIVNSEFYSVNRTSKKENECITNERILLKVTDENEDYDSNNLPLLSRELAGEPDGSADSNDVNESTVSNSIPLTHQPVLLPQLKSPPTTPPPPPPLSQTPSPVMSETIHPPRTSFLHSLQSLKSQRYNQNETNEDKSKPATNPENTSTNVINDVERCSIQSQVLHHVSSDEGLQFACEDLENGSSQLQVALKRQAPQPPTNVISAPCDQNRPVSTISTKSTQFVDDSKCTMTVPENNAVIVTETVALKSKDKCIYQTPVNNNSSVPEFTRSLSHDPSYSTMVVTSATATVSKRGSKVRSTLRKLLRFGSRSEDNIYDDASPGVMLNAVGGANNIGVVPCTPRVRPEIIHPLDLNKSGVQVLRNVTDQHELIYGNINNKTEEEVSIASQSSSNKIRPVSHYGMVVAGSGQQYSATIHGSGRPSKPPPPPRSQSLDLTGSPLRGPAPPARPPPPATNSPGFSKPTTRAVMRPAVPPTPTTGSPPWENNMYANLGDDTSVITPVKPTRSGNHREMSGFHNQTDQEDSIYEPVMVARTSYIKTETTYASTQMDTTADCKSNTSKTDKADVADNQTKIGEQHFFKRLNSCHSVIHDSVEDNYSAIVSSNYSALVQILQQSRSRIPSSIFDRLPQKSNIRWTDFTIDETVKCSSAANRVFYSAYYSGREPVTLCVRAVTKNGATADRLPDCLQVFTEFKDFIPKRFVYVNKSANIAQQTSNVIQVVVSVMMRQEVVLFHDWLNLLKDITVENKTRTDLNKSSKLETGFVLYQLIICLLSLQERNVDRFHKADLLLCKYPDNNSNKNLTSSKCVNNDSCDSVIQNVYYVPSQQNNDINGGVTLLPQSDLVTLHQCFIDVLKSIPIPDNLAKILNKLVTDQHTHVLLSKAKAVLELWLWGPPRGIIDRSAIDRQKANQHWLDLERSEVLRSFSVHCDYPLVLNRYERLYVSFLVQTDASALCENLTLFDDYQSILHDFNSYKKQKSSENLKPV